MEDGDRVTRARLRGPQPSVGGRETFVSREPAVKSVTKLTFWRLAQWRISEHKTVNTPQMLMRGRMFN
jgi:hypothetical protein